MTHSPVFVCQWPLIGATMVEQSGVGNGGPSIQELLCLNRKEKQEAGKNK